MMMNRSRKEYVRKEGVVVSLPLALAAYGSCGCSCCIHGNGSVNRGDCTKCRLGITVHGLVGHGEEMAVSLKRFILHAEKEIRARGINGSKGRKAEEDSYTGVNSE